MTPEQAQMLQELYDWMTERRQQQLSLPVDDASKKALGAAIGKGTGTTALTQVYTDSHGDTVTAPRHFVQSVLVEIDGVLCELPSLI